MCLSKVSVSYDKPSGLILDGWKEFSGTSQNLKFQTYGGDVKLDEWLVATGKDIKASDGKDYRAGFHIYSEENDIKSDKHHYRRVYYRRVTCVGLQGTNRCAIAQEMYVPSSQNAWPPPEQSQPDAPQAAPATPAPKPKSVLDRMRGKS